MNVRNVEYRYALARLALLSLCFLMGMIMGQAFAFRMPMGVGEELRRYFAAYRRTSTADITPLTVLTTAAAYVRYPLAAALLGYTSAGAALLCGTAGIFGFFLSFSTGCIVSAFGRGGMVLAAAALGIRCLVTLPCFFLLAVPAMENALLLLRMAEDQEQRWRYQWVSPRQERQRERLRHRRLEICLAALTFGICLELLCTPRLVRPVLEWIL